MAFNRPRLSEIVERIKSDIESGLGLTGASLRRSNVGVLSKSFGGAAHMLHGHLDWISKQVIIDTAEAEYLERHARTWGITRKTADYAQGSVTFTGTNGSAIPAGTALRRADGAEYTTDAEVSISNGQATAQVTAVLPGEAGNADAGVALVLLSPLTGVQGSALVGLAGITNGVEAEADESLRARLLARIQAPAKGGAASDYEQWATEVAGIGRAFVRPQYLGPGTVGLFVISNDALAPIPNAEKVAEVQAYIESKRPVTATVYTFAPAPFLVNMTIKIAPNTLAVREAIAGELRALFQREAEVGGTLIRSHISEAISTSAGEFDHRLIVPAGDLVIPANGFPVLGTLTFEGI